MQTLSSFKALYDRCIPICRAVDRESLLEKVVICGLIGSRLLGEAGQTKTRFTFNSADTSLDKPSLFGLCLTPPTTLAPHYAGSHPADPRAEQRAVARTGTVTSTGTCGEAGPLCERIQVSAVAM